MFIAALIIFGLLPGLLLRLIVHMYPRKSPIRREIVAELYHIPRWERPFWVLEQLETAFCEGLPLRLRQLPRLRRRTTTRSDDLDRIRKRMRRRERAESVVIFIYLSFAMGVGYATMFLGTAGVIVAMSTHWAGPVMGGLIGSLVAEIGSVIYLVLRPALRTYSRPLRETK